MTPQKALRISLPALLTLVFVLSPLRSKETSSSNDKRTYLTYVQAHEDQSAGQGIKLDLTVPLNNKKEKDSDHHGPDLLRHKRHADEDRHDPHHHHFDKNKSGRRIINLLTSFFLKIIIAVSYFSILLCSYMSICH